MWSQLGGAANVTLAVAYLAISASILLPLARTGQLRTNRLGLGTGLIFFSCGVGHAIHAEHALRVAVADGWGAVDADWHLGVWDSLTAVVAIVYWRLRQVGGPPVDAGTLFEDLRRRAFTQAFECAPNGMALVDGAGTFVRVNQAFAAIVDREVDALGGTELVDLVLDEEDRAQLRAAIRSVSGDAVELRLDRGERAPAWARVAVTALSSDSASLLVQLEDVTERRLAQARLNHLALHDPLTGLPNRLLFHDRAAAALRQARRTGHYTGCLYVDLDHFKVVNDSLGHAAGDQVLQALAERLVTTLRVGDTVARMGGDEFCLLLQDLDDPDEASDVAERALATLDGYVEIDGMQVTTGASIGVAVVGPHEDATSQTLVRDADTALYRAKGSQRGSQVVFDDAIRDDAERRLRIEADLRRGLDRGEISVVYQPQWSLTGAQIVGVEALVRWDHPTFGRLEPAEFIGVAVETGLVVELGRIVLARSVADLARWRTSIPDLELAANLSSRQLGRPGFVRDVQAVLDAHGVPPTALCLELTETDLTVLGRSALTTIDELRALGIRLAVDDVGTGQSSLTHLVTLPVDVIKIDRTFVEQVHLAGAKRAVVDALLSLARTIGVDVVAEGAETSDQIEVLRALGGDVVQGYVISRPVPADELERLLLGVADPIAAG